VSFLRYACRQTNSERQERCGLWQFTLATCSGCERVLARKHMLSACGGCVDGCCYCFCWWLLTAPTRILMGESRERGKRGLGQTTTCNTYSQLSCRCWLTDWLTVIIMQCALTADFPFARRVLSVCCSACKLNQEDAVDRSRWRKLMKDVWWSGWMWVSECFFWYWPTRVVPDKGSWNGCVCVCVCSVCLKGMCSIKSVQFRRAPRDWITDWGW